MSPPRRFGPAVRRALRRIRPAAAGRHPAAVRARILRRAEQRPSGKISPTAHRRTCTFQAPSVHIRARRRRRSLRSLSRNPRRPPARLRRRRSRRRPRRCRPPLPPPAPREAAKPEESAPPKPEPKIESAPGDSRERLVGKRARYAKRQVRPAKIEPQPEAQTQPPRTPRLARARSRPRPLRPSKRAKSRRPTSFHPRCSNRRKRAPDRAPSFRVRSADAFAYAACAVGASTASIVLPPLLIAIVRGF